MTVTEYLSTSDTLARLLGIAWLLPLVGFAIEVFAGYWSNRLSKTAGYLAVGCIGIRWGGGTWELLEKHHLLHLDARPNLQAVEINAAGHPPS